MCAKREYLWLAFFPVFVGAWWWLEAGSRKKFLNTENIKALAEISQKGDPSLHVFGAGGERTEIDAASPEDIRDLISMLAPVEGARVGVLRFPEYEFLFQTGRDPVVIYVRTMTPIELEFDIQGILYTGGDPVKFTRRIESIKSRIKDGDPSPDGPA